VKDAEIYRKTEKGRREIAERAFGLEVHVRRLLVMIDGQRGAEELSVYVRAGEFESTLERLVAEGFVERTDEVGLGGVTRVPAANDPVVFAGIKIEAMTEIKARIRGRLGPVADMLVAEINACSNALQLREKLRTLEKSLTQLLGQEEAVAFARRIGRELTRLVPEDISSD
jgi:DNA-binding PadR family transcriptional regulator